MGARAGDQSDLEDTASALISSVTRATKMTRNETAGMRLSQNIVQPVVHDFLHQCWVVDLAMCVGTFLNAEDV